MFYFLKEKKERSEACMTLSFYVLLNLNKG